MKSNLLLVFFVVVGICAGFTAGFFCFAEPDDIAYTEFQAGFFYGSVFMGLANATNTVLTQEMIDEGLELCWRKHLLLKGGLDERKEKKDGPCRETEKEKDTSRPNESNREQRILKKKTVSTEQWRMGFRLPG